MTVIEQDAARGQAPLSEVAAEAWIPRTCFKHGPPGRVVVELELLVIGGGSGAARAEARRSFRDAALSLPLSGIVTLEPGGQVELSSAVAPDLRTLIVDVEADLAALRALAARHGLRLAGVGLNPTGAPQRILDLPRYAAMEHYLDRWGSAGRLMMCSTASVQPNVEAAGAPHASTERRRRWDLLHAVAPALIAAFANSGLHRGRPTGWKSTRQLVWASLDPARTRAPRIGAGESLEDAWARWALDAPLMIVRRPHGSWRAPSGLTFRQWIHAGRRAVPDRQPPTLDDLAYHLTTLFPPVRARGPLEVRYLDALPGRWWQVPAAVVGVLVDDPVAADTARLVCEPVEGRWQDAARVGPADPALAEAASGVLAIAAQALHRTTARAAADLVLAFRDRWTARGRCPADDLVDVRTRPTAAARTGLPC
jgi:glutamate--cysteine ligase